MDDKDEIVQRLTTQLNRAAHLRSLARAEPGTADRRQSLRTWQADRLARTHVDLLASKRFGSAAAFFLTDIYSAKDVGGRDQALDRVVPLMSKFLPVSGLETVVDAIELDALSEDLDAAMVAALGQQINAINAAAYGDAYRKVDRRKDRERQIQLIQHLGQSLDRLARKRFAGTALALARKPAQLAGFGDLQEFAERGYNACRQMGSVDEFMNLVVKREQRILEALFAGDDSVLSEGPAPGSAAAT
jgi:hypothetical protein